jgi:hypothetical protein
MNISPVLRNVFQNIQSLTGECYDVEQRLGCGHGMSCGHGSGWDISTAWIEPAIAWIRGCGSDNGNGSGHSVASICSTYGIFEGNLYKFVMSLSNMIDELSTVASLRSDVDMLETLAELKKTVMAPGKMSWGESLYLRL